MKSKDRIRGATLIAIAEVCATALFLSVSHASVPKVTAPPYASLSLYSESYRPNSTQPGNQYPSLFMGGRYEKNGERLRAAAEAEIFINSSDTSARYLNVRELYAETQFNEGAITLALGRKSQDWSTLDSAWQLGIWQPRFRWNYLDPDVVGLTGLFAAVNGNKAQGLVFASPIYIPELGAQFEFKDGVMTSPNRFVTVPPHKIALFGGETPVRYNVDSTRINEIVFNPSFGAMARVGESRGAWAKAAYTFAPVNRIMLGYEGYLYLTRGAVEVTLHPRVVYHHLLGIDGGFAADNWRATLSAVVERPVRDGTPGIWTTEQLRPALLLSPSLDVDVATAHLNLSYLFSNGGVTPDEGPLATPSRSIFESRYPFRSAALARVALPLSGDNAHGLRASTRSIYDFSVDGVLLSFDLNYKHNSHWAAGVGADVVAASRDGSASGGGDFFFLNRANDRLRGRVTYNF